jgi:hypothetical protein
MKKLALASLLLAFISVSAQQIQQSLYSYIPQSSYQNIGTFSQHQNYFAIPLVGYTNVGISNSGFGFNDFVNSNGQVTIATIQDVHANLNGIEQMSLNFKNDILNFGFSKGDNNFFTINLSSTFDFSHTYTKDFLALALLGTQASGSFGTSYDLSGTSYNLLAYSELGFGYQRKVNDKLSVGGRIKYLSGILNATAYYENVSVQYDQNTNTFSSNSEVTAYDYGVSEFFLEGEDLPGEKNTIPNFSNIGVGLDFGASYKVMNNLTLSFNAVDFGTIFWTDGRYKVNDPDSDSDYDGVDLEQLHKDSTGILEVFQGVQGLFDFNEERQSYSSNLPAQIYLAGEYVFNDNFVFNGLFSGRIINSQFFPSYTVAGGYQIHEKLQTKLSYSIINNTYTNIGVGFTGSLGRFQVYLLADNLPGLIKPLETRFMNFSFGFNVALFRDKSSEAATEEATE